MQVMLWVAARAGAAHLRVQRRVCLQGSYVGQRGAPCASWMQLDQGCEGSAFEPARPAGLSPQHAQHGLSQACLPCAARLPPPPSPSCLGPGPPLPLQQQTGSLSCSDVHTMPVGSLSLLSLLCYTSYSGHLTA